MKHILKFTLPALALCAAVACSKTAVEPVDPSNGKELIAFSQEGGAMTKAVLTKDGFTEKTKIVVRIKAEDSATSSVRYSQAIAEALPATSANDDCNTAYGLTGTHSHLQYGTNQNRYWDDAFGRNSQLTVYAVAVPEKSISDNVIADDILGSNGTTTEVVDANTNPNWYTITAGEENTKIAWSVSNYQSSTSRAVQDIVYSNNIRSGETTNKGRYHQSWNGSSWDKSMALGQLSWQAQTTGSTTGKFDQGHLVFKHALAWITVILREGNGFNHNSNADFQWTNKPVNSAQSISLVGFPTSGKLDVSNGSWSDLTTSVDILQLDDASPATAENQTTYTLHGYIIPGTKLWENTNNVILFEVDNAKYYVTGDQIAKAIRAYAAANSQSYTDFETIEAGKHYLVNLSVGKKAIDNITAALLPWEEVNSDDAVAKNTYATFQFEDRDSKLTDAARAKFDIYRAAKTADDYIVAATTPNYDWTTGYATTAAVKNWDTDHWTTDWYWENNKTYYHFRAAGTGDTANGSAAVTVDGTNGDYFTIKSGIVGDATYKDYVWGAPFTFVDNSYLLKYSEANGFSLKADGSTKQISGAIGSTDSQIKMLLFHMTSQVKVNITTTTDVNKVVLNDGTKNTTVEILNFLPEGKVLMGTGAVSATGDVRTAAATMKDGQYTAEVATPAAAAKVEGYEYGIVPQALSWTDGSIGLCITTPDGNKYYVTDLSKCTGAVSSKNLLVPYVEKSTGVYQITEWLPHYKYTYNITVTKKAIENITASVLPWEAVVSDNIDIDLEN